MLGYYFITDEELSLRGNVHDVTIANKANVPFIQYRDKKKPTEEMLDEAKKLMSICDKSRFIINDRVDIALEVGADGVHLGQDDMGPFEARGLLGGDKIIGVTVHNVDEAIIAEKDGADYVAASPVFETNTKSDAGKAGGLELVKKIRTAIDIPLVAIGGIGIWNAPDVIEAGADSVCAISAVVKSQDVYKEIMKFQELFK